MAQLLGAHSLPQIDILEARLVELDGILLIDKVDIDMRVRDIQVLIESIRVIGENIVLVRGDLILLIPLFQLLCSSFMHECHLSQINV